jgi:DNA-binding SARP family transcriptional activator
MAERDNTTRHLVSGRFQRPRAVGLRRARLHAAPQLPASQRLLLVVAPAGAGKTTLLSHLATDTSHPTAWLTIDPLLSDAASVLSDLRTACSPLAAGLRPDWLDAATAAADLTSELPEPSLLVIDDAHLLGQRVVADVLQVLVRYQPTRLAMAIGARSLPYLDVVDRTLEGSIVHIDADALRFRPWEVDDLFRHCYGTRLGLDEVTALTERTGGWAAGLQLFHLATERQPPSSRRTILSGSGAGTRLTRDYLGRHILSGLPPGLRDFLVRTSVFDQLTAHRCDHLLGTDNATELLGELERRGLFTSVDDRETGTVYHYHEVLRSHLLGELSARPGDSGSSEVHSRAAAVLHREGAYTEAVRAYCLAQDWDMVRELLDVGGETLASRPGSWLDALPASIRDHDPWVLLALARRLLADGALERAAHAYRTAVAVEADLGGGAVAARELKIVQAWTEPSYGVVTDWVHHLRSVLKSPRPQPIATPVTGVAGEFAAAVTRLVRGELAPAAATFSEILDAPDLSRLAECAALLGRAVALSLALEPGAAQARDEAVEAAKLVDVPVLHRMATGLQVLTSGLDDAAVDHLINESAEAGDLWGGTFLRLGKAMARPFAATTPGDLGVAGDFFRAESATALASWASALALLVTANARGGVSRQLRLRVEHDCRIVGPLPYSIALLGSAYATEDPAEAATKGVLARSVAERSGGARLINYLSAPVTAPTEHLPPRLPRQADVGQAAGGVRTSIPPAGGPSPGPAVRIQCIGQFAVWLDDRPLDLTRLRPVHRSVLRLLAAQLNTIVPRDWLVDQLWPEHDLRRAHHCLQVAISELRRALEPTAERGHWRVLTRAAHGYQLCSGAADPSDLVAIASALRDARVARVARLSGREVDALENALALYTADLFADDDSIDWVTTQQARLRLDVAAAHARLSDLRADEGSFAESARLAELGLRQDPYHDALWRRLICSLDELGNHVAATAARARYTLMMDELGVSPTSPGGPY